MTSSYGAPVLALKSGVLQFDEGGTLRAVLPITCGTYIATGSAVTVSNSAVTATSQILITLATPGGTVSSQFVQTITPGTGFTVDGGGSDSSTYNYCIIG